MIRNVFRNRRRRILAASGTLALCASLAFAAWLTEGIGNGRAKVGSLQPLSVEPAEPPSAGDCFPGQACNLHVAISNPNGALKITRVENVGGWADPSKPGCPSTAFSFTPADYDLPLPAGGPTQFALPGLLRLNADAPSACQGATVPLVGLRVIASTP